MYGNVASKMGDEKPAGAPVDHTHLWTIFVKDPTGGDLRHMIKKVVFKLHDTYPESTRTVEEPPFEITETGWGEFEIPIRIYFATESNEKNITIYHHLKLHPYKEVKPGEEDKPIKSVLYDEVIFNEPTEKFFSMLTSKPNSYLPEESSETLPFSKRMEMDEADLFKDALNKVVDSINEQKDKLVELEAEKQNLR